MSTLKIPHILFFVGLVLIPIFQSYLYGIAICTVAVFIQIINVIRAWHNDPSLKRPVRLSIGLILLVAGIVGLLVAHDSGETVDPLLESVIALAAGPPAVIGSLLLLSLPTKHTKIE